MSITEDGQSDEFSQYTTKSSAKFSQPGTKRRFRPPNDDEYVVRVAMTTMKRQQ